MTIAPVAPDVNARVISGLLKGKSGAFLGVKELQPQKAGLQAAAEPELKVSREFEFEDRPSSRDGDGDHEFVNIPVIDLSLIETNRAELARKLGDAAREWGVLRVVNHGIPAELMKEMEIQGSNFFGISDEEKSELLNRENGKCYYTGNNTEEKRHSLHWAESFVMVLSGWTTLDLDVVTQATRDWSTATDEFRKALLEYVIGLKFMSEKLLQLAAESLGLKSAYFSGPVLGSGSISGRWNYYPACPIPAHVLGAHSHTDPNFLTLLQPDNVRGLQVEKEGRWYTVKPVEGSLIINIGDTFQVWSNGIFKSVLHRVLVNKEVPRFSVAWILNLQSDQSLSAPSELVDDNHPRLYRDITAREYFEKVMKARKASTDFKVFNGATHLESLKISLTSDDSVDVQRVP